MASTAPTKKTTQSHFSALLLSDFFLFCSFIFSHPLYLSYFIFFSPYLFKLLSFLSPLFITTSLLLLTLFTTLSPTLLLHHKFTGDHLSDSKVEDDNGDHFFEAYKIVFEAFRDNPNEVPYPEHTSDSKTAVAETDENYQVEEITVSKMDELNNIVGEKSLLDLFLESQKCQKEEEEEEEEEKDQVKGQVSVEFDKVDQEKQQEELVRRESKAVVSNKTSACNDLDQPKMRCNNGEEYYISTPKACEKSNDQTKGCNLGSFGSMRKEKEWRRTLACKLFEERHNVDIGGSEGMDLLWETYDQTDSSKVNLSKSGTKKEKSSSRRSRSRSRKEYNNGGVAEDDLSEEEGDEEESDDGQLCCLQAFKFSAGKMNLGMGRLNLVKISKTFRGIGWLHHVNRNGKKGYH